jgi:NtrC-family two-component system sensor histidine kinase KinB
MRSLRTQLLLSHLALVLLLGLVMSAGVSSIFALGRTFDTVLEGNFPAVLAARDLADTAAEQRIVFERLTEGRAPEAELLLGEGLARLENGYQRLFAVADAPRERMVALAIGEQIGRYQRNARRLLERNQLIPQSDLEEEVRAQILPALTSIRSLALEAGSSNAQEMVLANDAGRKTVESVAFRSLVVAIVAVALALVLALHIVRIALRPLAVLAKHAEAVATGDLSQKALVPRNDEIGALADSFNSMVSKLAEVRSADVRRLQRAERMTDAALANLYDPVLVTDAKGRIVYLNQAAEGLFGKVSLDPRIPIEKVVPDRRIVRAVEKAIEESQVTASEGEAGFVTVGSGEAARTYRLRVSPMSNEEASLLGAVAVFEDVTHLRVVDHMKNEFIGVASHELRTPVTSLRLSVDLLREGALGELNELQKQVIDSQRADLDRLDRLMRELLDLTRLEAGSSPPRLEMVHPDDLVLGPVQSLRAEADKKGVSLSAKLCGDCGQVRADRSQIGRVITNLVANAIRHTPQGGTVTVSAIPADNEVTFHVEDTGEGIPADYLKRIFERFVQVPGATQGGAGLGLSIAQHIVRAHGGSMHVESEVGEGSVFSFTLPRDPAKTVERQPA